MKDLGSAKQILGMNISCDRKSRKLWLSQEARVERVLERFNIGKVNYIHSPLVNHFKRSSEHCPISEKMKQEMRGVSYDSAVSSLIYVMVCIRVDMAHTVGAVSQFLYNYGKEHYIAVTWIFR